MKKWFLLGLILILVFLEVTILNYFRIFNAKPDLLLIVVIIVSLVFDLRWALIFSILSGVLKDIFSTNLFGINAVLFPLWSLLIIKLSKRISIDNNFISCALIFSISLFTAILTRLICAYLGKFVPLGTFFTIAFLDSLYTALVLPLMLKITKPLFYS
jgi:rod shape-determining protein MreD